MGRVARRRGRLGFGPEMAPKVGDAGGDRLLGVGLHLSVAFEDTVAKPGQLCTAAAAGAALFGFDQGAGEGGIELLDQRPAAFVAHGEACCRSGQRRCLVDGLQEVGLAGAERDAGAEHDAEAQALGEIGELRSRRVPPRGGAFAAIVAANAVSVKGRWRANGDLVSCSVMLFRGAPRV